MTQAVPDDRAVAVFQRLLARPGLVVAAAALATAVVGAFLPYLNKDSRVEAFIPLDNPVLALRDEVEERFGMSDPMALLVVRDGARGIFTPHTLQLVASLTEQVRQVDGVHRESVRSLSTVRVVEGAEATMNLVSVLSGPSPDEQEAERVAEISRRHSLLHGGLVSRDERSTLVVLERFDDTRGLEVYRALESIAARADVSGGERIYVTGHAALTATLGEYIDSDTRILYVAVTVLIAIVLAFAFRTVAGVVLPLILVGATLAIGMGTMGITGAPFTIITSALPVVLSALVVTDGIHILSAYYERLAAEPSRPPRFLVAEVMATVWRPCVGSRVTDIAGFAGLYLGSQMPPMKSFGLYGSVGIAAEMALALLAYPALLILVSPRPSPAFPPGTAEGSPSRGRRLLAAAAAAIMRNCRPILACSLAVAAAGATGAWRLVVNDSWMKNFDETAAVRQAAEALHARYGVITDVDLLIDSGKPEGMLEPAMLATLERLTASLQELPYVRRVRSFGDELSEIHRGMSGGGSDGAEAGLVLPESAALASQYLLLADSSQIRNWLDAEQRRALVRVHTDANEYVAEKKLMEELRATLAREVPTPPPTVHPTGMVAMGVAWVSGVGNFHVLSTLLSVGLCWLQMCAGFRSFAIGTLAILPMTVAMLLMYAVMGWGGIPLGIGTSMFAALAIGTGVDFAIHAIDRFMVLHAAGKASLAETLAELLATTGRAMFYSGAALILGFSALCTSQIPAVRSLGLLVTVSVAASLAATLTLLPAVLQLLRPRRILGDSL